MKRLVASVNVAGRENGLNKNERAHPQITTLFALANLWVARGALRKV